jgi:hypothetical protein
MGYSATSREELDARNAYRRATGTSFAHTTHMASTPAGLRTIHESVDPSRLNSAGANTRECLDSEAHPRTKALVAAFDETGSMGEAPRILQQKLASLEGALLRTGLTDMQLCFAAYGDAQNGEVAPLQVGQFESGIEMEDQLNNLYLEGMGGGNDGETSGLLMYYLARKSRLDCVRKRGELGYLLIVGDEKALLRITREEIRRYIGDDIQADLTIEQVVAEVTKLYHVYFFHYNTWAAQMQRSLPFWQKLLGAGHVIPLEGLDTVAEQMAMLVAGLEGVTDSVEETAALLMAEGADPDAVRRAGKAMVRYTTARSPQARLTGNLPTPKTGPASGSIRRL